MQYISDIHLEFLHIEEVKSVIRKIIPVAPILILAGDIGNPFSGNSHYRLFLEEMGKKFEKVFVIAGNHEYYGGKDITDVEVKIKEIVKEISPVGSNIAVKERSERSDIEVKDRSERSDIEVKDRSERSNIAGNITYLQNSYEEYNGVRWIGTTLWSRLDNPSKQINDVYSIKAMNTERYNELHYLAVENLEKMLEDSSLPTIVITHHMPSYSLIDPMYNDELYNMWFASDLDSIVERYKEKIKYWIYGHTHTSNQSELHGVMMLCNPIGYKGENPGKNYKACVSLNL